MNGHKTKNLKPPPSMRTIAIDERIAPLISHLWRLGFQTQYSCQGNAGDASTDLAYIMFRSHLEAALFAALAGPLSWDFKTQAQRERERPDRADRWAWEWRIEGYTVRFPSRDILRATAAMANAPRLASLVGAVSSATAPPQTPPPTSSGSGSERILPLRSAQDPSRSAPRICPACRRVVVARRKDARYCSRSCQLSARSRGRKGAAEQAEGGIVTLPHRDDGPESSSGQA
jgi:hypothetical protein